MRYHSHQTLRYHAYQVSNGVAANQSWETLDEQLKDLHVLATRFGLYDAADWLKDLQRHRDGYHRDFGEPLDREEITDRVNKHLNPDFPREAGRLS